MDFPATQRQINDLPTTFKRETVNFLQFIDSMTAAISRFTVAADGIDSQLEIRDARFGWLDVWGLLFGIPRRSMEPDSFYLSRILYTVNAGGGPALAISAWILATWGVVVQVAENFPTVGYSIIFPPSVTPTQIEQILEDIKRVRPAGVPFTVYVEDVGPYLDTVNFLAAPRITGAYLGGGVRQFFPTFSAGTPNTQPLLPTLLLIDPTINPA